jgi:hypothetical protein
MGYAHPAEKQSDTETRLLHSVYVVCVAAQRFFTQAAHQIDDSNLRYKFLELSVLHGNAAHQLPADNMTESAQTINNELAAVQFWYLQQQAELHNQRPQQLMLTELGGLLQQQLTALKQLIKHLHSQTARVTLAHLSAALQMANDQLLPLLKVLPVSGQKIQT